MNAAMHTLITLISYGFVIIIDVKQYMSIRGKYASNIVAHQKFFHVK